MGGKSRKTGQISKKLIEKIKNEKKYKNISNKVNQKQGLDLDAK